jgi:quercetin dioxygenase-like cupin family protein
MPLCQPSRPNIRPGSTGRARRTDSITPRVAIWSGPRRACATSSATLTRASEKATGNRLDVHLVRANEAPEYSTGWHRHKLGFHAIYMASGWARFMYEGKPTLVETGDFVNMPPGITHYLYDYSPDMCFLEIAMAGTPDGMIPEEVVEPFCDTPAPTPWAKG